MSRGLGDVYKRQAKQLLRNPNLSISVVGKKVGYPDQFHFSKIFRQATGMSPSEFRTRDS